MKKEAAQNRVDDVQEAYRQWLQLQEKLENSYKDLQESAALMQKMKDFYFGKDYRKIYDLLQENKLNLNLETQGEYSVMSEDAIWNALHEHQTLLWKFLKFAVKELDDKDE